MFADARTNGAPATLPTVRTFAPALLADCAERWKPATQRANADGVRLHILPIFGNRRVDAVTARDVRNWSDDLSATRAGTANRTLTVLSSMMKHAEALGLRREDSKPCKGLRRRKTGFKAHYLAYDEFAALGRAFLVVRADIARFFHKYGHRKPGGANRSHEILRNIFDCAMARGHRSEAAGNPCKGIVRYRRPPRGRLLGRDDLAKVGARSCVCAKETSRPASRRCACSC